MLRLLTAAAILSVAVAPAYACEWNRSVSRDDMKRTVASQPADDHAAPPASKPAPQKPS